MQSAITSPQRAAVVEGELVEVQGYAWSGGGRGIVGVDVSADGGVTWHHATLTEGGTQPFNRAWAWWVSLPEPLSIFPEPPSDWPVVLNVSYAV